MGSIFHCSVLEYKYSVSSTSKLYLNVANYLLDYFHYS